MESVPRRVVFLDIFRGIALINMIFYHALFNLKYVFSTDIAWFGITQSYIWQQFICWSFILIAGISCSFSRRPWRNGIRLLICSILLTVTTAFVLPEQMIKFGILHFMGVVLLLTWMLLPFLKRISPAVGFTGSLAIFIIIKSIAVGTIGIGGIISIQMPEFLYQNPYLFWLGFPEKGFTSGDYFPILPWIFLFWTGLFAGLYWQKMRGRVEKKEQWISSQKWYCFLNQSVGKIGQMSLFLYMVHQPVLYGSMLILKNINII